jgi:putative ABC transport system permease protein
MHKLGNLAETFRLAVSLSVKSLRVNLLRTSLSLLGISIGIFSVSAIYTGVDSLNAYLISTLDKFGNNTLFIDRFNYKSMGNVQWAKIRKMKKASYDEYVYLKKHLPRDLYKAVNFRMAVPQVAAKNKRQTVKVSLISDTYYVYTIMQFNIDRGRFYNIFEDKKGLPVAVIGANVAEALFPDGDPLGKHIKILGKKVKVIGVLKKDSGMVQINPANNQIFMPYNFVKKFFPGETRFFTTIMVLPSDIKKTDILKEHIGLLLRKYRKLKPGQENNFYINNIDFLKDLVQQSMKTLSIAGWILGGFSLLVGAFGIANIMFVSVKERTREIGIQKALGAKRLVILSEFLMEAVLLALIGAMFGLAILYIGIILGRRMVSDFEIILSVRTITVVVLISVLIGILTGFWPALQASKLDPIEAIRRT